MRFLLTIFRLFLINKCIALLWKYVSELAKRLAKKSIDAFVRHLQSSENYSGDIEGMLSDYAELLEQARNQGVSSFDLALKVTWYSSEIANAALLMEVDNLKFSLKLFVEGLALTNQYSGHFNPKQTEALLRLRDEGAVMIRMDYGGRVLTWGREAEKLFEFKSKDVLQRSATDSFVPDDSHPNSSIFQNLLEGLREKNHLFRLNTNQNITATGEQFWMFWINLPIQRNNQLTEIMCIGVRLRAAYPMRALIWCWRLIQQHRSES